MTMAMECLILVISVSNLHCIPRVFPMPQIEIPHNHCSSLLPSQGIPRHPQASQASAHFRAGGVKSLELRQEHHAQRGQQDTQRCRSSSRGAGLGPSGWLA